MHTEFVGLTSADQTALARKITSNKQADAACLDLVNRLAQSFQERGVRYCHWKSNINLKRSLEGEADLDFFVDGESVSPMLRVLAQLGFKAARIKYGPETADVTHHYGFDVRSGKLVHVHLFSRLLTGESFVKSHHLPFEKMVLESVAKTEPLVVVTRTAELVLFVVRTFIKYGSLPDVLRLLGNAAGLRKELCWLLEGSDLSRALSLLHKYCPAVGSSLFLTCVSAIEKDHSLLKKVLLARRVRRQLRQYAEYSFIKRIEAYARVFLAKWQRLLKRNARNKMLQTGGAVIAIVGGDATGKSTLVAESGRWLGKTFIVKIIHTGKPPSSWLTAPANAVLALYRRLTSTRSSGRFKKPALGDSYSSQHEFAGLSSLIYALRAVTLAWDRRQLLRKARRQADAGAIIICDRYPSRTIGAMDSPRLRDGSLKTGLIATAYNRLSRLEKRLYDDIPPPDIVLKLKVTLETAMKRNRERQDQDGCTYLEARHRQSQNWHIGATRGVYEIDTEQTLEETIADVRKTIWERL
jgi:thymidylate kinase